MAHHVSKNADFKRYQVHARVGSRPFPKGPNSHSFRLLTEAPRCSPSVPSHDGNYAFFTVSTYSLRSQTATVEIKILNLKTEEISLFSDDAAARSLQWLPGNQILFLKSAGSNTELWIGDATGDKTYDPKFIKGGAN